MDSRLRGNDINCVCAVIPAKAGIHTAFTEHEMRERGERGFGMYGSGDGGEPD